MADLRERIARALYECDEAMVLENMRQLDPVVQQAIEEVAPEPFDEEHAETQEWYRKLADAILAELRTPDDARERRLEEALKMCRGRFAEYALNHLAKGTEDGERKAQRNTEMVSLCDAALREEQQTDG